MPLTLKQRHITAVSGIVSMPQNIIPVANLDYGLDLRMTALCTRNVEYNPKVHILRF